MENVHVLSVLVHSSMWNYIALHTLPLSTWICWNLQWLVKNN